MFEAVFDDEYFGDIALFLNETYDISAKALKFTELLSLSREDLL